jgi:hypothetical protein
MFVFFNNPQPLKLKVDFGQTEWFGQFLTQLYELKRTFRPIYERNLSLTYTHLFKALYLVNILSVIVWLFLPNLKSLFAQIKVVKEEQDTIDSRPYEPAKVDLVFIVIAALTIYMAIRSRRFMPIAAVAACPLLAALITQIIHTLSANINFNKLQNYKVSRIPYKFEFFLAVAGTCAVIFFGTYWSLRFKYVYLDPWPTHPEFTSVFMRMTASDRKPFHAGDFIRENNLQGKMFNYWTEGGFVSWAQNTDPNTGKTPLRLFMDGRAQAAYDPKIYKTWSTIMAGGPTAIKVAQARRKYTNSDYKEMGKYISDTLRKHKVWLILMPGNKNTESFNKAIGSNNDWRLVFFNNIQKMYVDIKNEKGKKLLEGVLNSETVYPEEFTKKLMHARMYGFQSGEKARELGLQSAIEAFNLHPSQVPLLEMVSFAKYPKQKPKVDDFCKNYIQDVAENLEQYRDEDSFFNRIASATLAIRYLKRAVDSEKNPQYVSSLSRMEKAFKSEQTQISKGKKW